MSGVVLEFQCRDGVKVKGRNRSVSKSRASVMKKKQKETFSVLEEDKTIQRIVLDLACGRLISCLMLKEFPTSFPWTEK